MKKISTQTLRKLGIEEEIKDYINTLLKNDIKPEKVILFGSFAKQKKHKYSDIDLAVVSDTFENDQYESLIKLSKLTNRVADRIEPIAITSDQLESKYHPLIGEINKYGKIVYEA